LIGAIKKAVGEQAVVPNPTLLQHLMGRSSKESQKISARQSWEKIRDDHTLRERCKCDRHVFVCPHSNGELRDVKSSAVSVSAGCRAVLGAIPISMAGISVSLHAGPAKSDTIEVSKEF
jgi:hypothetical protein